MATVSGTFTFMHGGAIVAHAPVVSDQARKRAFSPSLIGAI